MTCQELVELVTDYLEGALTPTERLRFEQHLEGCLGCRAHLAQMRRTIQTAGRLTEASLPAGAKEKLLGLFRSWKDKTAAVS